MNYFNRSSSGVGLAIAWLLASTLAGCAHKETPLEKDMRENPEKWARYEKREALRKSQEVPFVGSGMSCFRHANVPYIQGVYVEEVPTGQASPGMIGGNFNCGGFVMVSYRLPVEWRPGMKVKVRWRRDDNGVDLWLEKYTTIPYYAKPGDIFIHFFQNDQVRVVVAKGDALTNSHPMSPTLIEPPPEIE